MSSATKSYTIAFYNVENLFDTEDNPNTHDDDFLPSAKKRWTDKRYLNKLHKLSTVIPKIGEDDNIESPVIVGLAEVENKKVLIDLVETKHIKDQKYKFVHFDSLDERGIDVALLYKEEFKVDYTEVFSLNFSNENGSPDFTRDILLVKGLLNKQLVFIIVNHWSSRRSGVNETEHKRILAAKKVNQIILQIKKEEEDPKIIVMGDFNDNPNDNSLVSLEEDSQLFNPFKTVWSKDKGSLNYNFEWLMFDQILVSTNFLDPNSILEFEKANVYNTKFLTQYDGKFKGQPYRSHVGKHYKGGYSDHFPVFLILKLNKKSYLEVVRPIFFYI